MKRGCSSLKLQLESDEEAVRVCGDGGAGAEGAGGVGFADDFECEGRPVAEDVTELGAVVDVGDFERVVEGEGEEFAIRSRGEGRGGSEGAGAEGVLDEVGEAVLVGIGGGVGLARGDLFRGEGVALPIGEEAAGDGKLPRVAALVVGGGDVGFDGVGAGSDGGSGRAVVGDFDREAGGCRCRGDGAGGAVEFLGEIAEGDGGGGRGDVDAGGAGEGAA